MPNQLLPPVELAAEDLGNLTPRDRVAVWLDMLDAGHKLVLAGLAREFGPDANLQTVYRAWYAEQMAEHDRVVERMLRRMQHGRTSHAC